jgi:endonuclease/exonuclease/phosphatase family metal-dependent hydrolase
MRQRILLSNLGYARGINGCLSHHLLLAHRHFYCSEVVQKQVLGQLSALIAEEDPDICCFVEIDQGSANSANFNQLAALVNEKYTFFDIENKYGASSRWRLHGLTRGKSNAFMAKVPLDYEKLSFSHGTKRLVYKLHLPTEVTLFFAHFSLSRAVRVKQLQQLAQLLQSTPGEVVLMGDFNILTGFGELAPLTEGAGLRLLNREDEVTFRFHRRHLILDLCLCSPSLAERCHLRVIPQPFSDHAALLLDIYPSPSKGEFSNDGY